MKKILFSTILILSCLSMTSCAKCTRGGNNGNDTVPQVLCDTVDVAAQKQHVRDSLMTYLTCNYGDFSDELCIITSKEFSETTHDGLNVEPMLLQSVNDCQEITPIVIVNYVGKTLIGVDKANLMVDSVQYTMPYIDSVNSDGTGTKKYEIHVLCLSVECVDAIANGGKVTIAVWGDGGAAKCDLTDRECAGLKTLIDYFDTYRTDK